MAQLRKRPSKAATVATVAAFALAALTALALRGEAGTTDESMPFLGTFILCAIIYFIFAYTLVLIAVGLFKDNRQ